MNESDSGKTPPCPYTEGLRHGLVRHQRCRHCGAAQTLARCACVACGSASLAWCDATGRGTVYALTVVTRAPSDSFRALVPYTLALVDLDEGPRLMAHAETGAAIGDRVVARFFEHHGQPLLRFVPLTMEVPGIPHPPEKEPS